VRTSRCRFWSRCRFFGILSVFQASSVFDLGIYNDHDIRSVFPYFLFAVDCGC